MSVKTEKIDNLIQEVTDLATNARAAAMKLALVDTGTKNKALQAMAGAVLSALPQILEANALDVAAAAKNGVIKSFIERLTLDEDRVKAMAESLKEISQLPDPIGEVLREWTRPNGLRIRQVRVPLGVIGMIYESRPNVTVEAAGLCLKSGNAVILRGGSEAYNTNKTLLEAVRSALAGSDLPNESIQLLPPKDRKSIALLSRMNGLVDLIIARGSEEMINEVSSHATVPVLGHGKGVCHVYIDKAAEIDKGVRIAVNAKLQRPGVCNAMETLLVHSDMMMDILPRLAKEYISAGVEMRGDERVCGLLRQAKPATEEDWSTEYADKILSIKVVDSLEEAINHINTYGSRHTDSIVTEDKKAAEIFQKSVDSSCVMVNASTRLHDGAVFGFGSEIGISTHKLHARGTMGLRELTTTKYLIEGSGQIRE